MTIMWRTGTFLFWNIHSLDHQEAHKECKETVFIAYALLNNIKPGRQTWK